MIGRQNGESPLLKAFDGQRDSGWHQEETTGAPHPGEWGMSCCTYKNAIIVFGGQNEAGQECSVLSLLDPINHKWNVPTTDEIENSMKHHLNVSQEKLENVQLATLQAKMFEAKKARKQAIANSYHPEKGENVGPEPSSYHASSWMEGDIFVVLGGERNGKLLKQSVIYMYSIPNGRWYEVCYPTFSRENRGKSPALAEIATLSESDISLETLSRASGGRERMERKEDEKTVHLELEDSFSGIVPRKNSKSVMEEKKNRFRTDGHSPDGDSNRQWTSPRSALNAPSLSGNFAMLPTSSQNSAGSIGPAGESGGAKRSRSRSVNFNFAPNMQQVRPPRFLSGMTLCCKGRSLFVFGGTDLGAPMFFSNHLYTTRLDVNEDVLKGTAGQKKMDQSSIAFPTCWFTHTVNVAKDSTMGPEGRAFHSATLVGRYIYVFGGLGKKGVLGDLWLFDTKEMQWLAPSVVGRPPCKRYNHSAIAVGTRLFICCGEGEDGIILADVHVFDTVQKTWHALQDENFNTALLGKRHSHISAVVQNTLYVYGGEVVDNEQTNQWSVSSDSDIICALDVSNIYLPPPVVESASEKQSRLSCLIS